MSLSSLSPEAQRAADAVKLKADLVLAAQERAKERELQAASYSQQDWQKTTAGNVDVMKEWEERSSGSEGGGEDPEEVWCVACGKGFGSGGSWENHERSRKHLKNLEKYAFVSLPSGSGS